MKSYIFLADGFEEIEALATLDMLRRAGIDVLTVSINDNGISTGAHNVPVTADVVIGDVDFADAGWLILPGGMPGASNLAACQALTDALKAHNEAGGHIAAICASPAVVLAATGILKGHDATCYPGFEEMLIEGGANPTGVGVVVSGNIITGKGPGLTPLFALTIIDAILGHAAADAVSEGMLLE